MHTPSPVIFITTQFRFTHIKTQSDHLSLQFKRIALYTVLICSGFTATFMPNMVFAEASGITSSTEQFYSIPAGSLNDALNQFSKQSGINLSFDSAELKTLNTQGLNGNFDTQSGLNSLLIGSGLQAELHLDGYTIKKISKSAASTEIITTFPLVEVGAKAIDGYVATSSWTATKTNTLLRDVPQAISVVTQELIQDQAIRSMEAAVRYVPGVGVSSGEGNRDALVFRGNRTTADFFVDGVRDDAQIFRDLYNVDRIEVLKGANGMIFGRGGSGGVINRVTKQAGWDPVREFSFQGGSYGLKRITADVGHVLNDRVAFRLNGLYDDADSFRFGVDSQRLGISPTVTILPTNRTKVVLNMERYHDERTADRGITSFQGRPVPVGRSQFFGDPKRSNSRANVLGFNSLIEHRFEFGLTVRNKTNYNDYDKAYKNVFANSAYNGSTLDLAAYNDSTDRHNVFNQTEFLYALDTGPIKHTLMAGVEVGHQTTDNSRLTGFFNNDPTQTNLAVSLQNSITNAPITFARNRNQRSVVDITSLYIQDQIELMPQLQAVVGVRYDHFKVDYHNKMGAGTHLKTNDDLISPRYGLIYKPFEPISFYTSYSKSYAPRAGEQLTSLTVTNATLSPEKFTNLEAGIKWDVRPDLALTAAVYRLDRTNVITADPNDASQTFLSKGQRTKGVELGVAGRLTPQLSVMGGYAYQDGEITKTLSPDAVKGATLAELPTNTFSMWSRYDFVPGWGAALGVIHRGSMYASIDNTVKVGDFTRLDAALFATLSKNVRAQINIENLTDTKYIVALHNNNNLLPGAPITARASVIVNF